jgi:hypothetical protein
MYLLTWYPFTLLGDNYFLKAILFDKKASIPLDYELITQVGLPKVITVATFSKLFLEPSTDGLYVE